MNQKRYELEVGLFVLIGLVICGVLVVGFGKFDRIFNNTFQITVEFPDASGLLQNSQVLYRGAKVGWVEERPVIGETGDSVTVKLNIMGDVRIPKNAGFVVGEYGLLGDRYVNVLPPKGKPSAEVFQDGSVAKGTKNVGFADLAGKAEPVLAELKPAVESIRLSAERIHTELDELLTDEFRSNIHATAKETKETMAKAKASMEKIDKLLEDLNRADGPVGLLIKDEGMATDLRETFKELRAASEEASLLTTNLRKKGVLFYKDISEKGKEEREADKTSDSSKVKRRR